MATKRKDRAWIAGGIAAAIVIAGAGWLLFISPQADDKAAAEQQLVDTQTQNIVLQQKINRLRDQSTHASELEDQLRQVRAAVPSQHDVEGFTRQLTTQAQQAGVTITSITPGAPTKLMRPSTESSNGPSGSSSDNSADASPAGADAVPTGGTSDSAASAPPKSAGPAGSLYSIDVTVVTTGSMDEQRAFLSTLEKDGARRSLVTSTAFSPLADDASAETADTDAASDADSATDGAAGEEPNAVLAVAPLVAQWTLTSQLQIFVAPQSPDQEAKLTAELDGNG